MYQIRFCLVPNITRLSKRGMELMLSPYTLLLPGRILLMIKLETCEIKAKLRRIWIVIAFSKQSSL